MVVEGVWNVDNDLCNIPHLNDVLHNGVAEA